MILKSVFEKLKSWLGWLAGAVIGLLVLMLGIERHRRKKAVEEVEEVREEKATVEIEKAAVEHSLESVEAVQEEIVEVDQKIEELKDEKADYNSIVDAWNSGRV